MRLTERQALAYLRGVGFEMSARTYYHAKKKVESLKLERLIHIATIGFQDQHMDRIDNTELALKLMWENYHLERDPYKRFQMAKDIIFIQPYLSSYYEASKLIIENRPDIVDNIKNLQSEKDSNGDRQHTSLSLTLPREGRDRETETETDTTDPNFKF